MSYKEISPEDLFMESKDGKREINHEFVESYGLFNLTQGMMNSLMTVYLDNAAKRGKKDLQDMTVFSTLAKNIRRFPREVVYNFKYGKAYQYNLKMLKKYSK